MPQANGTLGYPPGAPDFDVSVPGLGGLGIAPAVMQDAVIVAGSGYTSGVYYIQPVASPPNPGRPWIVTGWALNLTGTLIQNPGPAVARFGRLGSLLAGLVLGTVTANLPAGSASPYNGIPQQALPPIQTLWDGSVNDVFPWWNNTSQPPLGGDISASFSLPQPLELSPGEQLGLGLWLTPSLAVSTLITIARVAYSITYQTKGGR